MARFAVEKFEAVFRGYGGCLRGELQNDYLLLVIYGRHGILKVREGT
jgi:hypothetical protein